MVNNQEWRERESKTDINISIEMEVMLFYDGNIQFALMRQRKIKWTNKFIGRTIEPTEKYAKFILFAFIWEKYMIMTLVSVL